MLINGNDPPVGPPVGATTEASTAQTPAQTEPSSPPSPPTPTTGHTAHPVLDMHSSLAGTLRANGVLTHTMATPVIITANTSVVNNNHNNTDSPSMTGGDGVTARAILVCRKTSHPFAERRVPVDMTAGAPQLAVKVGRAVARSKPSDDNFVFDCKVLSRNHASLWFEDQKFYLQDTRSSNGTFVNNQRLSPANEESAPREVYSGDVVQFGVDVMENQKKVTHGCIIATLRLYYPDGTEAKHPDSQSQHSNQSGGGGGTASVANVYISSQQLYALSQYLTEALHREQILENKLETLERVVSSAQESANVGWKSLVEEDRLLSRIETLQNKLQICLNSTANSQSSATAVAANNNKESVDSTDSAVSTLQYVREEMLKLIDDKDRYESAAKEAIQRSLEEKLIVLTRLHEFEVSAHSNEEECARLQEVCATSAREIDRLASRNDELAKEIDAYAARLKGAEDQKIALIEATAKDREELEEVMAKLTAKEAENSAVIRELRAANDTANLQLEGLRLQLEVRRQQQSVAQNSMIATTADGHSVVAVDNNNTDTIIDGHNEDNVNNSVNAIGDELQKVRKLLAISDAKCNELSAELAELRSGNTDSVLTLTESTTTTTTTITATPTEHMIDTTTTRPLINGELSTNDNNIIDTTTVCVDSSSISSSDGVITCAQQSVTANTDSTTAAAPEVPVTAAADHQTSSQQLSSEIDLLKDQYLKATIRHTACALIILKELLAETRAAKKVTDEELSRTVTELENLRSLTKQLSRESDDALDRLERTAREVDERNASIQALKNQINESQERVRQAADDCAQTRRQLADTERVCGLKDSELSSLRVLLDEERKVQQKYANNYDQCRRQLAEQQALTKQSQTEAELLRKKVYNKNEELRTSRNNLSAVGAPTVSAEDHERVANECQTLRARLDSRDNELYAFRAENQKLAGDHQSLQQSYQLLQQINRELEARGDRYWKERYDSAVGDVQTHETKLTSVCKELEDLKLKSEDFFNENQTLSEDLKTANEEMEVISYQNKIATACAVVPLIMLLIAVIMAYYPSVSTVTGTTDL